MADTVTEREYVRVFYDDKRRNAYIAWSDDKGNVLRVANLRVLRMGKLPKGFTLEMYVDPARQIADGAEVIQYKVKTTKTRV